MSTKIGDLVRQLANAATGIVGAESSSHVPAATLTGHLVAVRQLRLQLQALEARLAQALKLRQAS